MPGVRPHPAGKLSRRAIDEIVARRTDEVVTECGCLFFPGPLIRLLGEGKRSALCSKHRWQIVHHNATLKEVTEHAMGKLPRPEYPDEPPF